MTPQSDLQSSIVELANAKNLDPKLEKLFERDLWERVAVRELPPESIDELLTTTGCNSMVYYNPAVKDLVIWGQPQDSDASIIGKYESEKDGGFPWDKDFAVRVPIKKDTGGDDHFLMLIHELAHTRFEILLRKNIEGVAKKYPGLVRRLSNGMYVIDKKFRVFLTERYAAEIEILGANRFGGSTSLTKLLNRYKGADPAWNLISRTIFLNSVYDVNRQYLVPFLNIPLEEVLGYSLD